MSCHCIGGVGGLHNPKCPEHGQKTTDDPLGPLMRLRLELTDTQKQLSKANAEIDRLRTLIDELHGELDATGHNGQISDG